MNHERGHLRRLSEVWLPYPIYFITVCAHERVDRLAHEEFRSIACEVWYNCGRLYGWATGRYVIMPDHVHFFATDACGRRSLSWFVGKWKEWTAKYCAQRLGWPAPLWQPEFFDHVLRSSEGYERKWEYVERNPVRAGLVADPGAWAYQGALTELRLG
ncbi:transposase [Gemmata sp. JC717]|uniref:REP-associated tyrosine transposase n=1 Tax=Gemmata algarum TaxID=2975278 RepID=UPI0021BB9EDE|nr:transposase [Gemmata algarum]MDY3557281.1 transposase [Gemmata algarum]